MLIVHHNILLCNLYRLIVNPFNDILFPVSKILTQTEILKRLPFHH